MLKHLEDHLLNASITKNLNRKEVKYVSRRILEALNVLHADGFVHTGRGNPFFPGNLAKSTIEDVKPDNVFVNFREGDIRFSDVQLGDLGGTYPADSKYAQKGTLVGSPMWTSPEVLLETPWNTATDIWSFGTLVRSIEIRDGDGY